jgi:hypothetical protein
VIVLAAVARNGLRVPMALRVLGTGGAASAGRAGWRRAAGRQMGGDRGARRGGVRLRCADRRRRRGQKLVEDAMHLLQAVAAASSAVRLRSLPGVASE